MSVETPSNMSSDDNESAEVNTESGDIMAIFASVQRAADGAKIFKKCAACHSIATRCEVQ